MSEEIRIRSRRRDGGVDIMVLMLHPMESGLRRDADGRQIPAHFITDATITVNDRVVLKAELGIATAQDPLLKFRLEAVPTGARIRVQWRDNRGKQQAAEAALA